LGYSRRFTMLYEIREFVKSEKRLQADVDKN
jgi:hypothetical protein